MSLIANQGSALPSGKIDLHCHLLPGIDDGCRTLEETLASIRALASAGFVGSVCTPHILKELFPENRPAAIAERVLELQRVLAERTIDYTLWPGGEIRLDESTTVWLAEHGVPTLGQSQYVLVDFWGAKWPAYADRALDALVEQSYQPILAHPERMGLTDLSMDALLEEFSQRGVLLQGNVNSIAGMEGRDAEHRAIRWLVEDRYHVLALDYHRPNGWETRLEGIARAGQLAGAERLRILMETRPREILGCVHSS